MAHARLGDTDLDCFRRYSSAVPMARGQTGEVLLKGAKHLYYRHKGWRITAAFLNDRVAAQSYRKEIMHTSGRRITDDELKAILEAEGNGQEWTKLIVNPTGKDMTQRVIGSLTGLTGTAWKRADGSIAVQRFGKDHLLFATPDAAKYEQQRKESAEAAKKANIPKF